MRPRKDYITYHEWRERGETVVGAFFRTVPYQYIWLVVALLAIVAASYWMSLASWLLSSWSKTFG